HVFGPESPEMMDMTVRTDQQVAELLHVLDEHVGRDHYVFALTADHGVKSASQVEKRAGLGGGLVDLKQIQKAVEDGLREAHVPPAPGARYVAGLELPWLYFDHSVAEMDTPSRKTIVNAAADIVRRIPGIADVFTQDELAGPPPSPQDRD